MKRDGIQRGARVIVSHDEFGMRVREIRGCDFDAVYSRALDVKNAIPPAQGPYIASGWRDKKTAEWVVRVSIREPLE